MRKVVLLRDYEDVAISDTAVLMIVIIGIVAILAVANGWIRI